MADKLQHGTYRNPNLRVSSGDLTAMNRRCKNHLDRARKRAKMFAPFQKCSPEERELRKRLRASRLQSFGIDDALFSRVREQQHDRANRFIKALESRSASNRAVRSFFQSPHVDDPSGMGAMWWGQTSWWNDAGLQSFFDSSGFNFSGGIYCPEDGYVRRSLVVVAQFFLSSDRVPPELIGVVFSAPMAKLLGNVGGICDPSYFDFGDQWAKCFLNLNQTVFGRDPVGNWWLMASPSSVITLLNIDSVWGGAGNEFLPGPLQMPVATFGLNPGWDIQVDLNFWFDIQLTGDNSRMGFAGESEFPTDLLQTFQWNLSNLIGQIVP